MTHWKEQPMKEETPVQQSASLDERTVQKVAKGEVPKAKRKPKDKVINPNGPLVSVNALVGKKAQEIVADQHNRYSRIEIVDSTTVIVR